MGWPMPKKVTKPAKCVNPHCKATTIYAVGRCNACYKHHRKYGEDRPKVQCQKVLGRHQKGKPRWCKNCGSPEIVANLRCNACRLYFERNDGERPRHLWDVDAGCKTCSVPLATVDRKFGGYCEPCGKYAAKGKERPRHLWGIGEFGWCACGRPATAQHDGFGCCALHVPAPDERGRDLPKHKGRDHWGKI